MESFGSIKNNIVAIVFVGTNKYIRFFEKYYNSINELFIPETHKEFFVFTDNPEQFESHDTSRVHITKINNDPWPLPTLMRFKYMNSIAEKLQKFTHVIFIDADMYANQKILEHEIFAHDKNFFAVQHPAFLYRTGSFERDSRSLAAVNTHDDLRTYYQACFFGGKTDRFVQMISELERRIDEDLKRDIVAIWHDESHLNKYFAEHSADIFTLDPGFAHVDYMLYMDLFEKKFIHINKKGFI